LKSILFLQGPPSSFFSMMSKALAKSGHNVWKLNLCPGDVFFWKAGNSINYKGSLEKWESFISEFLFQNKIDLIILYGEQRTYHKIAISCAYKLKIPIIVSEFGYIRPDWLIFEFNGISGSSLFPRNPEEIHLLAHNSPDYSLNPVYKINGLYWSVCELIYPLLNWIFSFSFPNFRMKLNPNLRLYIGTNLHIIKTFFARGKVKKIIDRLLLEKGEYFVFPLQVEDDFQISAYSSYSGMSQAIREVVESFAKYAYKDAKLIVKLHPLESIAYNWEKLCKNLCVQYNLKDRLFCIDGGSLEKLLKGAAGVVTINSTVGIKALIECLPVKVLGQAVYDISGLTFKGTLEDFWVDNFKPDKKLRDNFIRALASCVHLRGSYYSKEGLAAAVKEAVYRIENNLINKPLDRNSLNLYE